MIELTKKERNCLIDNVYFEARGESFRGQVLVASTTINRANSGLYPRNVCSVVYQTNQFSWTKNKNRIKDRKSWRIAAWAANAAIWGHGNNAMYFHNININPKWAKYKVVVAREGNHIFYK